MRQLFLRIGQKLGIRNRAQLAWCLYDWGNSAFATSIMAVLLPIYFFDVAAKTLPENIRTAYWGYTSGLSLVAIVILSPLLGAIADLFGHRRRFTGVFTVIGAFGTGLLFFVQAGDWLLACTGYFLGNIGFYGAMVFNDSMLPHVADADEADSVSLAGYALGYLGGGLLLALHLWWVLQPEFWGFADKGVAVRAAFASVAVWWVMFTVPVLMWVKEPALRSSHQMSLAAIAASGWTQLGQTWREVRQFRQLTLFLVAFWLYSDGIGTIIKMATTYGRAIGIEQGSLIMAMLVVQLLGLPLTFAYGPIARRFGAKPVLMGTLVVYSGICVFGYFMNSATDFWILAVAVACVQGGSQALSRSIFAAMIPRRRSSEFFAFYSVSSKVAGVMGPLMFGFISQFFGESRLSVLFLVGFFVVGGWILQKVRIEPVPE